MDVGRSIGLRMRVWLLVGCALLLASVSFIHAYERVNSMSKQLETPLSGLVKIIVEIADEPVGDHSTADDTVDDTEESEYAIDHSTIDKPTTLLFVLARPFTDALYTWSAQNEPDYQPRPPQV